MSEYRNSASPSSGAGGGSQSYGERSGGGERGERGGDRSGDREGGERGGRRPSFRTGKRKCPFTGPDALPIDYKDINILGRFVTERGKIMPSRITGVSAKKQRKLSQAIKRARYLALMPFSAQKK